MRDLAKLEVGRVEKSHIAADFAGKGGRVPHLQ